MTYIDPLWDPSKSDRHPAATTCFDPPVLGEPLAARRAGTGQGDSKDPVKTMFFFRWGKFHDLMSEKSEKEKLTFQDSKIWSFHINEEGKMMIILMGTICSNPNGVMLSSNHTFHEDRALGYIKWFIPSCVGFIHLSSPGSWLLNDLADPKARSAAAAMLPLVICGFP